MKRAVIVYESKYGNTELVAQSIAEGMKMVRITDAILMEVKEVDLQQLAEFDAIVIGSPNHLDNATGDIRKFIEKLGSLNLDGKNVAIFDTYMGKDYEKAVTKMEKLIKEKAPGLNLAAPGLSLLVKGMKGPVAEGELTKSKALGVELATQLKNST